VETLAFILHNLPVIGERTVEHLSIVGVAVGFAIVTGVPIGIGITQSQRIADTVLYLGSIVMTIPSIALFGVLIPILSKIGQGIGWLPAVIAAMLYAQLPIIRNTYTAIRNVDPALRSAAIGMGMSVTQRLARVEIPIALPVIIAGIRIAVVINIGVTAIAAYIGAGGLGTFISRGISQTDIRQLITGALRVGAGNCSRLYAVVASAAAYTQGWLPGPHEPFAMIRLDAVTRIYATPRGNVAAVDNMSFEVDRGEICVLLGPSGCGKTTTLRMINRLVAPTSGKIFIDGRDTDATDPVQLRRGIGYVIQQIGLFPNMTVAENIGVVPRLLGWHGTKWRRRAEELLALFALEPAHFLDRYPNELSGGQAQRVGVARALAVDPPVLLMDEPFAALDPVNREVIQDEFLRMQKALRKTILFVSHDIDEAVKMADRIAIFRAGKLVQFATPDELLARPIDDFIASFVGRDRTLKRLRLILAREVMTPISGEVGADGPSVSIDDDLRRVAALFLEHADDALHCVDAQGRTVGRITRAAVAARLGPEDVR
jgi:osmoprotectant transport system ATP-binding protein